jgi:hypothetical protein
MAITTRFETDSVYVQPRKSTRLYRTRTSADVSTQCQFVCVDPYPGDLLTIYSVTEAGPQPPKRIIHVVVVSRLAIHGINNMYLVALPGNTTVPVPRNILAGETVTLVCDITPVTADYQNNHIIFVFWAIGTHEDTGEPVSSELKMHKLVLNPSLPS